MKRFVEGEDRGQLMLFPECLDDWVDQNNPARVIAAFVDVLDLTEQRYCRSVSEYLWWMLIIATFACLLLPSLARAMEITVAGDQLILSGPVVVRDYDEVVSTLAVKPQIKIVILRNSPGGDAPTGYHLGELFRRKSLQTAVSGYCYSSCSRLYLGGKERYFTDDYPPEYTQIGFHGHYNRNGDLNAAYVAELHLKDWIIRYSDGKADPALVERWINIPRATGLIHFYNPALVNIGGYSTFMCQGTEPGHPRIFDCKRIPKTALDLGVATSTTLVHSSDQQQIRQTILPTPPTSGYAAITDDTKLPGIGEAGREQYRRFLAAPLPRAFAIAPSGSAWAWNSSLVPDAAWRALIRCAERANSNAGSTPSTASSYGLRAGKHARSGERQYRGITSKHDGDHSATSYKITYFKT